MIYKRYLIFDFGASNCRTIVANYNGEKFRFVETHRFINRPVLATETLYWDILRLFSELKIGIQASIRKFRKITSMGIDSWSVDFAFLDKNGKLVSNPYHYRDRSRVITADKIFKLFPKKELFKLTGGMLTSVMSLIQMYHFVDKKTIEIKEGNKFLMIPDIFNYFLTGEIFNEFTNLTTTLMYNQEKKKLEDKILKKIGVSKDLFPKLINPGINIGMIKEDVCQELEIPKISVITPATHDTASAVAGIPLVNDNKCWAFIIIGTWGIIGFETSTPVINEKAFNNGFANSGGVEESNLLLKDITGLWIIQQCREKWIKNKEKNISWNEIANLSNSAKALYSFIDVDNPIFGEVSVNMPQKIINVCRKSGQNVPESIGEIARCIYESLIMKFKLNLNLLEDVIEQKIEILHLVGGGVNNNYFCQWVSDATGIPVYAGPTEATSTGNLLMQLKGTGEIKTLKEGRGLTLNSSNVSYFEPSKKEEWEHAFNKYLDYLDRKLI